MAITHDPGDASRNHFPRVHGVSLNRYTPPDHYSINGNGGAVPRIRSLLKARISMSHYETDVPAFYKEKNSDIATSLLIEAFGFNAKYKDIQRCVRRS
jgi:hypothetical protein